MLIHASVSVCLKARKYLPQQTDRQTVHKREYNKLQWLGEKVKETFIGARSCTLCTSILLFVDAFIGCMSFISSSFVHDAHVYGKMSAGRQPADRNYFPVVVLVLLSTAVPPTCCTRHLECYIVVAE